MSGLYGSVTHSSLLDISERSTNLASSGQWWSQNASIEVSIVTATIAGEMYTFSFTVKNQECRRNAVSVSNKATPVCFSADLSTTADDMLDIRHLIARVTEAVRHVAL